jgi:sulfur-oxidizing protein SoxY
MSDRYPTRTYTRRQMLAATGGLLVAGMALRLSPARADAASAQEAIDKVLAGKAPKSGKIALKLPQIAENGNTVPISFTVDSPMTANDYVKAVHLFADGNPRPNVATFHFTPDSGKAEAATRIRLAKTQNVIAVAEMSDGSVYMVKDQVKVTIGGCGG